MNGICIAILCILTGLIHLEELIIQAKEKGLAGVAITDHDTTASWQDAKAVSLAFGYPLSGDRDYRRIRKTRSTYWHTCSTAKMKLPWPLRRRAGHDRSASGRWLTGLRAIIR